MRIRSTAVPPLSRLRFEYAAAQCRIGLVTFFQMTLLRLLERGYAEGLNFIGEFIRVAGQLGACRAGKGGSS